MLIYPGSCCYTFIVRRLESGEYLRQCGQDKGPNSCCQCCPKMCAIVHANLHPCKVMIPRKQIRPKVTVMEQIQVRPKNVNHIQLLKTDSHTHGFSSSTLFLPLMAGGLVHENVRTSLPRMGATHYQISRRFN